MTYCVGILVNEGLVLASDSRTHAEVDNFATFSKMTVFEQPGERVIVLLSSGNLAGTQAVISSLRQHGEAAAAVGAITLWSARTMFDVMTVIADAVRSIERRDGKYLEGSRAPFNPSFIVGGQIRGERMRLFRTFAEGNFIEAGNDMPFFQTGEAKYGKPIIDRVIQPSTQLADTVKCVLVSFDSTMKSNLSVGMPIDLVSIPRDGYHIGGRHRFVEGDGYFATLRQAWAEGVRRIFRELPSMPMIDHASAPITDEVVRPPAPRHTE